MSQMTDIRYAAQDIVGVYDGYSLVFRDARPITASVREEAKMMEHPLESGAVVTDHMVIQPVEIELTLTLIPETYRDVYKEIKDLYQQGTLLTVQTRADSYGNQVVEALPHEENPDIYDTVTVNLKLKEVRIVKAQVEATYEAQSPAQTKTVDRGEVQPREEESGSWGYRVIFGGKD
jgi:hypothetical protein